MKLKLKNIGTLKQAEIDLSKDLIILAGPNNTGKTYAAYTVYGVCDLLKSNSILLEDHTLSSKLIPNFESLNVIEFINGVIESITKTISKDTSKILTNIFTSGDFKESDIQILLDNKALSQFLADTSININGFLKDEGDDLIKFDIGKMPFKYTTEFSPIKAVNESLGSIFNRTMNFYFNNLFINTAERSAINIFSKELSIKRNNIVDQLLELRDSQNGDANQLLGKLQRYPLPIRDSLAISEDLANISRNKSEYSFLADKMEEVLLDGKINISKYGEVQYSPNKSKVKNLSMNLSGSIVKSLSNLVIYFRHLAKKGDFIIIDEPELNLHPDNQRKVARLFGEIINQGFKVMISTHSDYIIRELNNLIMLKSGGEKAEYLANKYGYEEKQLIDYQRVGAYLFDNNKNISLEVTEVGFEVSTIDAVINELNNASEEIYFTLFD